MNRYEMLQRQGKKTLASEMKHWISIQAKTSVPDGEGGHTDTWATSASCWAAVSPIQARQQFEYKSVNVDASHLIKVRGNVTIAEANQILFGSRIFEVLTVEDIQERGIVKVVTCKERR